MDIITSNLSEKDAVYCKYSSQSYAQPAYIELDCRGEGKLSADYNSEIGNAIPFYLWHNLAVRWGIPSETSSDSILELFKDQEFIDLCNTILEGFEEHWNGSNYVGKYTEEALQAIQDADTLIDNSLESLEMYDVNEYLFNHCYITDHWSTQTIEEAVEECLSYLEPYQVVDGDIEDALIEEAIREFEHNPIRLTITIVNELVKRGKISQEEALEWIEEYN